MQFLKLSIIILIMGCSNSNIESAEKLWSSASENRKLNNLHLAITNYKSIIENHAKTEYAVKSQFQIADIYLNDVKDYPFAINEFETLITNYPNDPSAKKAHFMVAYIYSNYLDAYSNAIENYENFLEKYPNDELIPSVEFELEGLSKYQVTIDSLNNL